MTEEEMELLKQQLASQNLDQNQTNPYTFAQMSVQATKDPEAVAREVQQYLKVIPNYTSQEYKTALGEMGQLSSEGLLRTRDEIQKQKDLAAEYARIPSGIDFRPLASLADTWTGSKLSETAQQMAPKTPEEKLLTQSQLQKGIAEATGGLAKDQIDLLGKKLAQLGYMDERTRERYKDAIELAKIGSGGQAIRSAVAQDRLASGAADKIHNDKIILRNEQQKQQIDLDRHTLDTAPVLTPQIFNEIQIGLARAISGGSQTAVSTQEKVEFKSLQLQLQSLKQRITNSPQDIESPEVRKMLSDVMDRLGSAYSINSYERAKQKLKGAETAYRNTPNAYQAMREAAESYNPKTREPLTFTEPEPSDTKDKEAIDWAMKNRGNPDAESILKMHGVK